MQRIEYTKGDPVRLTPGSERLSSRLSAGDEGVHTGEVSNNGYEIVDFPNQKHVYTTQNEIEPVKFDVDSVAKEFGVDLSEPDALDPSRVKPGDTVALLRREDASRLFDLEVGPTFDIPIGGHRVPLSDLYENGWALMDHQPAPEPEWKPSDVVSARLRNESVPDRFWYVDEGDTVKPYFVDDVGVKHSPADLHDIQPMAVINPATVVDELVDSLSHALGERLPPEAVAYISRDDRREWVRGLLGHAQPNLVRSALQVLGIEKS